MTFLTPTTLLSQLITGLYANQFTKIGLGDMGDRTPGLLNANQTLYH